MLRNVKPVVERVRELQAEALARIQPKLDISRERVGRNLDEASRATSPSQVQIDLAIEANNAFVERLEQIAAEDQGT